MRGGRRPRFFVNSKNAKKEKKMGETILIYFEKKLANHLTNADLYSILKT